MENIIRVEKEIEQLRIKLRDKEDELNLLKSKYESEHSALAQNVLPCSDNYAVKCGQLPKWAIERYSRQILLRDIGVAGQAKLCSAKVLIVGAGGLGCPAAMYLAGAGIGEIGIVDYDTVDLTNVHRQLLHREQNVGMNKAESAAQAIRSINSRVKVNTYKVQLDSNNAIEIACKYNIVLDCTDNAPTRYLLSDLCVLTKLPLISGSALKLEGQLTVYCYRGDLHSTDKESKYKGPCYRCVFPTPPSPDAMGSCSQHGVAGPVPGVIGTLQAMEAMKYLVGLPSTQLLVGRMLLMDVEDMSCRVVQLRNPNPTCAACSPNPTITHLVDYEVFCSTIAKEKPQEIRQKIEKRKIESEKRMKGKSYYGFRTETQGDKTKYIQDVLKSERKLGPPCKSEICLKNNDRYCFKLSQNERQLIFDNFWKLNWTQKRDFVKSSIEKIPAKRRRLNHIGLKSRKGDSKMYFLIFENQKVSVCRVTFLNTLGIKEAMVRCWLNTENSKPVRLPKEPVKSLTVISYIDSLPKVDSKCNYCLNSNVNIKYVDVNVKNQFQLYNIYVKNMKSQNLIPASRKTFAKVLSKSNLKIFKPKNENDVCDLVTQHNINLNNYQNDKLDSFYTYDVEQWS